MVEKKTICFDFDWVIHWYRKGWHDWSIYDEPVPWIKTAIEELRDRFRVVVYSTRCRLPEWVMLVNEWLKKYWIEVDEVSSTKPIASVYIDDRWYKFTGNCYELVHDIENFKTRLED